MATPRSRPRGALPWVALLVGLAALVLAGSSGAGESAVDLTLGTPTRLGPEVYAGRQTCVEKPATKPKWDASLQMNHIRAPRNLGVCGTSRGDRIEAEGGNRILGRQGDDEIHAANGVWDRIDAGGGNDEVEADNCDTVAYAETVERRGVCRKRSRARQSTAVAATP
jgi:hypothetical protein